MKFIAVILSAILFMVNVRGSHTSAVETSSGVVIMQLQAFGNGLNPDSAYEEMILLYNSSSEDININNWCVNYTSSSGATTTELACVDSDDIAVELWLKKGTLVSFATSEFLIANPGFHQNFIFNSKLSNSSGHVWLEDESGAEVDRIGWGAAALPEGFASSIHDPGDVLSRDFEVLEIDTNVNSVDFSSQPITNPIVSGLYEVEVLVDVCENIEGEQTEIPQGYEKGDEEFVCDLIPTEDSTLLVTELLPNAPSYDSGQEFIEIYNPNDRSIDLAGYRIQLGLSFSKEYVFDSGVIKTGEYLVFSDTTTGLVLPNSSSASIRLITPVGKMVSETGVYSNANDDVSWALVEDKWIYTNQITPGSQNKPYLEPAVDEVLGVTSVLAPCPAGKYRNPATNRCKSIETATSQLAPCDPDEYRNPETNRCKKISSSSSALSPCPEGQERNPETNRCRNIAVLGGETELPIVTDIKVESSEGQLNWPVVLAALGGTLAYMIYEWRNELAYKYRRLRLRYEA